MTLKNAARFWSKVEGADSPDECWVWMANAPHGYGQFWLDGGQRYAHRLAYEYVIGPIPEGMELDHRCRNKLCVNPAHLDAVTHGENMWRGVRAKATHCKHGHEYTPENTYMGPRKNGQTFRVCRTCIRERQRARTRTRA
jgi:hypothetical protein